MAKMKILREYMRSLFEAGSYVGISLDKESRNLLLQHVPPSHPLVYADHVTLIYEPSKEQVANVGVGARVALKVTGLFQDEKGQAVTVQLPEELSGMSNRTAHITISTAKGTKPYYSKQLITNGDISPAPKLVLFGTIGGKNLSENATSSYKELHIFDFDGTIFNSPHPPQGVNGEDWWSDPRSLAPPCVPDPPPMKWFNTETLSAMQNAIANPHAYVVLMTGRVGKVGQQVARIMNSVGIQPDEFIFNNTPHGVEQYKSGEMLYILKNFPTINKVHFWEDRPGPLSFYEKQAKQAGKSFFRHLVKAPPMKPEC